MHSKIICGTNACDLESNLNKFLKHLCQCGCYEVLNIFPQQVNGCCGERVIVLYKQVQPCCEYDSNPKHSTNREKEQVSYQHCNHYSEKDSYLHQYGNTYCNPDGFHSLKIV